MDADDLEPRKRPQSALNLEAMSVGELEEHIAALEAEIARARAEIDRKQSHRSAAESLFRS
jgi:uncharacterized small protein (DUF1192 family)